MGAVFPSTLCSDVGSNLSDPNTFPPPCCPPPSLFCFPPCDNPIPPTSPPLCLFLLVSRRHETDLHLEQFLPSRRGTDRHIFLPCMQAPLPPLLWRKIGPAAVSVLNSAASFLLSSRSAFRRDLRPAPQFFGFFLPLPFLYSRED